MIQNNRNQKNVLKIEEIQPSTNAIQSLIPPSQQSILKAQIIFPKFKPLPYHLQALLLHQNIQNRQKNFIRILKNKKFKKNWSIQQTKLLIWVTIATFQNKPIQTISVQKLNWEKISSFIPGKNSYTCMFKWLTLFKYSLQTYPWRSQEQRSLLQCLKKFPNVDWKFVSQYVYLNSGVNVFRSGKQCREHFFSHLKPQIKKQLVINRGCWNLQEDIKLLQLYLEKGKKWYQISKLMNGRTDNSVKNRFILLKSKINQNQKYKSVEKYLKKLKFIFQKSSQIIKLEEDQIKKSKDQQIFQIQTVYNYQQQLELL